MVQFSLAARPVGSRSWLDLARRAEGAGFAALLVPDHPGVTASPYVALAAAATVTTTVRLGSYVSNAGVRDPALLATDVATLDLLSDGRAALGIGAGHTPAEWEAVGRERPGPADRVDRAIAVADATRRLLRGGRVEVEGLLRAELTEPRPRGEVPLTVGGGNPRLLDWAAREADVVALSGLGRTLPDGHTHTVRWREEDVGEQTARVRAAAAGRAEPPALEALVQLVVLSDDAAAVDEGLAEFSRHAGLTTTQLRACPYVLAGPAGDLPEVLAGHAERFGITRYVVREPALGSLAPLLADLADVRAGV